MRILIFTERVLSVIFWTLIMFGFDEPYIAFLTVFSAMIHEIGHITMIRMLKKESSDLPRAQLNGLKIRASELSYRDELLAALGGPLINLITGLVCLCFFESDYVTTFGILNIFTMISNLLPLDGYDGYKCLYSLASIYFDDNAKAERLISGISFFFTVILCFFTLYLILRIGEGYWIFGIYFAILLSRITKSKSITF